MCFTLTLPFKMACVSGLGVRRIAVQGVVADSLVVGGLTPSPSNIPSWTSLAVQWMRIFLPVWGTWVQFLVQEGPNIPRSN